MGFNKINKINLQDTSVNYRRPAYLLILLDLLGFSLLFMAKDYNVNVFYNCLAVLALFVVMYSTLVIGHMGDKFILLMTFMLLSIGVLVLCRINIRYGFRQIIWIILGGISFFVAYFVYYKVKVWDKLWFVYFLIGVILFVVTLLFGKTVYGSKNWISIGGVGFQPSEITKIMFIMCLSCYYCGTWSGNLLGKFKPKWVTLAITYIFVGFLVLQRDWGTMLVMMSIYLFMVYVYEPDRKLLFFNIGALGIIGFIGYKLLYHIQVRVSTWLDPWSDIANKGYQITQSLFAIASGGYFGRGLGNGSPYYIPEVHSDFIFAAICEEMGIFGGVAIILLFFLIAYRCFKISIMTDNAYDKAVSFGVTVMFALQTFIIIGGVIKMIPLTGITLPFVSYGGTSIIISFASLGIVQAISAKTENGIGGAKL